MSMNERLARVGEIIDAHGAQPSQLIAILQDTQTAFNYLSQEDMTLIADRLGISTAKVYSVATFYENFSLEPKGKHIIRVCDGTACHVRKSQPIYDAIHDYMQLTGKRKTDADGLFTLETVACSGRLRPVAGAHHRRRGSRQNDAGFRSGTAGFHSQRGGSCQMSVLTREGFHALQAQAADALARSKSALTVLICAGTGCIASGSMKVYENLRTECQERGLSVYVGLTHHGEEEKSLHIKMSGCHGFCEMGCLVHIEPLGVMYVRVKPEDCHEIVERTLLGGEIIERLTYHQSGVSYPRQEDIPFYKKQHRVVLKGCGDCDAEDLEEYIAKDGYRAFEKALFDMTDEAICREISDSGLRGRGGGGFPAGRKWESVRKNVSDVKYIVCNGDEGDPGAFMDRSIMEGNPHSVIEGMMIAGVATGATEGYIYVRAEYPLAVERLQVAIDKATQLGLLGDNIMDSGFSFHMHINRGAGAFVCGEGSALTASIEGKRGMPRTKPPRTVDHGLWGKPTVLNNVETFANVPGIISRRRRLVPFHRHRGQLRHQDLRPHRQRGQYRPCRGSHGHHPAGDHLRHRRRHPERQEVQGRADRRPLRRLPHRGASGSAPGLRLPEKGGRHRSAPAAWWSWTRTPAWWRPPASSCTSPRTSPAASAFPAGRAPSACWKFWIAS